MEGVERAVAGDGKQEAALVALVDHFDRDAVRAGVPEEGDLEAVLLTVRELSQAGVHGGFLSGGWPAFHVSDLGSRAMPPRPGNPPSDPGSSRPRTPQKRRRPPRMRRPPIGCPARVC